MSTKSKGTSVAQKLASLAKKTGVQYENLATEFLIFAPFHGTRLFTLFANRVMAVSFIVFVFKKF
ncbi:MAG: hypothetical protein KGL39_55510 [Patescibacteria group bacterium]|nr:hypothetical protein [Patescibacteria group bacterium]